MVKEFKIKFNKGTRSVYTPGKTIAGRLILEVEEPKSYQQIEVRLKGKGSVIWTVGSSENRRTYQAKEKYANKKVVLWRSKDLELSIKNG